MDPQLLLILLVTFGAPSAGVVLGWTLNPSNRSAYLRTWSRRLFALYLLVVPLLLLDRMGSVKWTIDVAFFTAFLFGVFAATARVKGEDAPRRPVAITQRQWSRSLRLLAVGAIIGGAYLLTDAAVRLVASRQLPMFAPTDVTLSSLKGAVDISCRFVASILYVGAGVATLARTAVARGLWVAVVVLWIIWALGVPLFFDTPHLYWISPVLWVSVLLMASLCAVFLRRNWMDVPQVLTDWK